MASLLHADTRMLRAIKKKPFPWYLLEGLLFENGYQAVVLYRIASWFKRHGIPFFGPLFARLSLFLTGVDVAPGAVIGPGLLVSHGVGLVIGDRVRIGANAVLLHQVTIGAPDRSRVAEMPVVGDNVYVGAGARLIGAITVGDNVIIGANAVVTEDVPADTRLTVRQDLEAKRQRLESPSGVDLESSG